MRILILDVYRRGPFRVTKDTNGAYGTVNDYGDGLIPKLLSYFVSRTVDWPPLHAVYTAGQLKAAGHSVVYSKRFEGGTFDLCLVPSSIVCHETEVEAVRKVTEYGIPVGVIGPFASAVPEPYIDAGAFVVSGEPEMFFHEFDKSAEELKNLGPICQANQQVPLDDLAMPAWEVIFSSSPPKMRLLGNGKAAIPILATRGCPYSCFYYCTYPLQQGRKTRPRDPDRVVAEMAHWQDTLGVSSFIFRDPVFSINRKHTMALCDAISKSGRKFEFAVEAHLNNIDDELAHRLQEAGLRLIYVGIESVAPEVLEDANRFTIPSDEQMAKIRQLESMGIRVKCMYILGLPKDNHRTVEATFAYARKLRTAYAQFSVFTPYPGTPAFAGYKDKIIAKKYEDFTQWHLIFKHEQFSPEDIRMLINKAYTSYYMNIRWIAKYSRSILMR